MADETAKDFYVSEHTAPPAEKDAPGMQKLIDTWYKNNPADTLPYRYYIISQFCAMIMTKAMELFRSNYFFHLT